MEKLTRSDLMSLEDYAAVRADFRQKAMAHKRNRIVPVGEHVTLHFEDRLTMQYQLQEVLRAEKIFDAEEIEGELSAYNPLIPDGLNFKATMMIEYPDPDERRIELARLIGIEDRTWVRIGDLEPVYAIADEDMERDTEDKTSAVHYLRFQINDEMAAAAAAGAPIAVGIDHENYAVSVDPLAANFRDSLAGDVTTA